MIERSLRRCCVSTKGLAEDNVLLMYLVVAFWFKFL